MKQLSILMLAIVVSFPVIALTQTESTTAQVGRYSIESSFDGVYFLDTATGALWHKERSNQQWKKIDSPVKRAPKIERVTEQPASLTLSKRGTTMPMVQREKRAIPGSSNTLFVRVGDITGGQVFVEVVDNNGHFLMERTSLKTNEFKKFEVKDRDVYIQVTEMINNLLDDDICKVHVSFKKPKPR